MNFFSMESYVTLSIPDFETYLKTKIEKLARLETESLDCKSPDYLEHFSTKSFDESKASVYFTPNDGHLSPQPLQLSPIHINYINEGMIGCESAAFIDDAKNHWRSNPIMGGTGRNQRNSFTLPCDYLDEADESLGNFIIPEPVYNDSAFRFSNNDRFLDAVDTPTSSLMSVNSSSDRSSRKRKKRFREHRRSRPSIENEMLLMHDVVHDVSKGARPKVYGYHNYERANQQEPTGELTNTKMNRRKSDFSSAEEVESDAPCTSSSVSVKKVNSQVNIDEKTGKVVLSSTSNDRDLATNMDGESKMMNAKVIKLQTSSSLPDLKAGETSTPSSTGTISSNSNNQIAGSGHGVHVILAVESQEDDKLNQMDGATCGGDADNQLMKKNIRLNIVSNGSSSSASSNNLEYGDGNASLPSTL